ncbi:PAS domain S-box protein [Pedobacter heparinus]|uniref:histidine kinase n=1 Tax=Pedobacter heparinus (strain ATCC 13125 / DSM 2366 / CIP 104194 / JCM 7457 / NBRC 12017 / NCIMB 9290 / NRRL B-14731 / HIM 762-3) TaxID=485917 RepID=C6Y321_PEDHD|nr:PAS domain S-box protein [Pedobacter heparinus]ACU03234.1 PAS sensor protein [Pedobacter heparinus DSM 2366]
MKTRTQPLLANHIRIKKKIVLLYLLIGFTLLFVASVLINVFDSKHPETDFRFLHHYKYILFILITAVALYILLGIHYKDLSTIEDNYYKLFEGSPGAVYVMEKSGFRFLAVNDVMVRKYGYSREELLKMSALDIRPEVERKKLKDYLYSAHDEGHDTGIWLHQKKNGDLFYVLISHHSVKFQAQEAYAVIAIDIDQNIRNEKRLREIAWTNSHEIRKPVSNILGLAELIKTCDPMEPLDPRLVDLLSVSASELDIIVKKINLHAKELDRKF